MAQSSRSGEHNPQVAVPVERRAWHQEKLPVIWILQVWRAGCTATVHEHGRLSIVQAENVVPDPSSLIPLFFNYYKRKDQVLADRPAGRIKVAIGEPVCQTVAKRI